MFDIFDLIPCLPGTLKVIDVGAMSMGDEELFAPLVQRTGARVVGFEPVQAECDKLNALHGDSHLFLPYVIGDGTVRTFHTCNMPFTSSLYEPNAPLLSMFQNLENLTQVVDRRQVQTIRLDDVRDADDAAYLKLDVQGAELDVLRGAQRLLEQILVIQTEVEFVPMYLGQPLFAEVDQALRAAGFLLHRWVEVAGRTFQPMIVNGDINRMGSQALWGQVMYVRNFMELHSLSQPKLLNLAAILHLVCQSYDMVPLVLRQYDRQAGTQLAIKYIERITASAPEPTGSG